MGVGKTATSKELNNKLNLRDGQELNTSLERLELYKHMNTVRIDTTNISIDETVDEILKILC